MRFVQPGDVRCRRENRDSTPGGRSRPLARTDGRINGGMRADARGRKKWEPRTLNSGETGNMSIVPAGGFDRWAVHKQRQCAACNSRRPRASPMMGDGRAGIPCRLKGGGQVRSGSQQQWLTRNSALEVGRDRNWKMVVRGYRGAPLQLPDPTYTTDRCRSGDQRETVFLFVRRARRVERFTRAPFNRKAHPPMISGKRAAWLVHERVRQRKPATSAAMRTGRSRVEGLISTPGNITWSAPLHVTAANTIVSVSGLATLYRKVGVSAIDGKTWTV